MFAGKKSGGGGTEEKKQKMRDSFEDVFKEFEEHFKMDEDS